MFPCFMGKRSNGIYYLLKVFFHYQLIVNLSNFTAIIFHILTCYFAFKNVSLKNNHENESDKLSLEKGFHEKAKRNLLLYKRNFSPISSGDPSICFFLFLATKMQRSKPSNIMETLIESCSNNFRNAKIGQIG